MSDPKRAETVVSGVVESLQEARLEIGMSKNRLAKLAGVDPKTVAFVENGERSPTLYTLVLLADALDADLGSVIDEALDRAESTSDDGGS